MGIEYGMWNAECGDGVWSWRVECGVNLDYSAVIRRQTTRPKAV